MEDFVEESALERDEEEVLPQLIRDRCFDDAASGRQPCAERRLDTMKIVKHVWCAEELKQPKTGVSCEVKEGERVPAAGNFDDDHADLGEGCVSQRGLHVALHTCRHAGEYCCQRTQCAREHSRGCRLLE